MKNSIAYQSQREQLVEKAKTKIETLSLAQLKLANSYIEKLRDPEDKRHVTAD